MPWPEVGRPRRAGVSSFGISGTNAHVILEQARPVERHPVEPSRSVRGAVVPWVVSAKTADGVAGAGRSACGRMWRSRRSCDLVDVGFSLATTRAALEHRAVVVGADRDELLCGLGALAAGEPGGGVVSGVAGEGRMAFLFTGQGAQRVGMGRGVV